MDELNCGIVRDLFPSYEEDLLHESVRAEVAAHLAACPACAEALAAWKRQDREEARRIAERDLRFRRKAADMKAWWKGFLGAFFASMALTFLALALLLRLI